MPPRGLLDRQPDRAHLGIGVDALRRRAEVRLRPAPLPPAPGSSPGITTGCWRRREAATSAGSTPVRLARTRRDCRRRALRPDGEAPTSAPRRRRSNSAASRGAAHGPGPPARTARAWTPVRITPSSGAATRSASCTRRASAIVSPQRLLDRCAAAPPLSRSRGPLRWPGPSRPGRGGPRSVPVGLRPPTVCLGVTASALGHARSPLASHHAASASRLRRLWQTGVQWFNAS